MSGQEEIISIENRLKEINLVRNDLVGLIASGDCDEDKFDNELSKQLYQEEQQLSDQLELLKSQNKTSIETHEKFELETFNTVLIRMLIDIVA